MGRPLRAVSPLGIGRTDMREKGRAMSTIKAAGPERMGATTRTHARKAASAETAVGPWIDGRPPAQGLFDPAREHDACGVGFIADMSNAKRHDIIEKGLQILLNLDHRGAVGADPKSGDGCGMLVQIPHRFFAEECAKLGFALPEPGHYAVGTFFLPRDPELAAICRQVIEKTVAYEGQVLLGFREPPTDNSDLGESVRPTEPLHLQVFIGRGKGIATEEEFERRLYIVRKQISGAVYAMKDQDLRGRGFYPVSISCRTVVYKGMLLAPQLGSYYKDLRDERFESALALVHQRFSTNTFPSWQLAHPYRMVAHNGEINTLRGNVNWMAARQASVDSRPVRQRHLEALADLLRGPVGHGLLRQRARIPGAWRIFAGARHDDAHPRGVVGQQADGGGQAGLLRISRRADGALGRAGLDRLHRRAADRRHARPQRAAPGALHRDEGRPGDPRLRGRRAADPARGHHREVAPAAGQDAAHRPRQGPHRLGRRGEGRARRPPSLRAMAQALADRAGGFAPRSAARNRARTCRCSIASRRSATRRRTSSC